MSSGGIRRSLTSYESELYVPSEQAYGLGNYTASDNHRNNQNVTPIWSGIYRINKINNMYVYPSAQPGGRLVNYEMFYTCQNYHEYNGEILLCITSMIVFRRGGWSRSTVRCRRGPGRTSSGKLNNYNTVRKTLWTGGHCGPGVGTGRGLDACRDWTDGCRPRVETKQTGACALYLAPPGRDSVGYQQKKGMRRAGEGVRSSVFLVDDWPKVVRYFTRHWSGILSERSKERVVPTRGDDYWTGEENLEFGRCLTGPRTPGNRRWAGERLPHTDTDSGRRTRLTAHTPYAGTHVYRNTRPQAGGHTTWEHRVRSLNGGPRSGGLPPLSFLFFPGSAFGVRSMQAACNAVFYTNQPP